MVWSEPLTLDPTLAGDFNSASIIDQLFSGLVEEGPDKDVVPAVAQSWEVLDGGRKYIFHLRPDVRWSDGTPVTAQDFEYAWKRALAPATGSPIAELLYDVKGARAFHQGEVSTPDQVGVKALDEITLVVELEEPTGYFLQLMTHNISYPVPQHIVTTCGENWTMVENIVTNGPFRLESWNEGGPIILTRNPTYYGRFTGNLRCIEIIPAVNTATTLEMYEATDLDVLDFLVFSPVERDTARQRYAGEYVSIPGLTVYYLGFNTNCRAFTDPRVRRAFAMAITKERLGDVERGYAFLGSGGFIPPGMPGHSAGIGLPFDVEQARRLLEEAGYPNGRGFPAVELLAMANARAVRECELLQAQWREHLGVEISWQTLEWAAYLDRLRKDLPPAFLMGWKADYPDPDNFLRAAVFNDQDGWHNPTYQRQVEEARRLTDQPARMKLYQQADRILIEEAVKVPLYYERNHLLVKPWVKKYPISAVKTWFYKDVIIESH